MFIENFIVGGVDLLCGFENNIVGLCGVICFISGIISGLNGEVYLNDFDDDYIMLFSWSLGGNVMVLGGIEFIVFMLFVEVDMDNLVRISLFVDVGNVWDIEFDYDMYKNFE